MVRVSRSIYSINSGASVCWRKSVAFSRIENVFLKKRSWWPIVVF
jgi:hypothetical protein